MFSLDVQANWCVLFFFYRVPMSIEPFSQAAACLADVGHSTHSASNEVNYTYRLAVEALSARGSCTSVLPPVMTSVRFFTIARICKINPRPLATVAAGYLLFSLDEAVCVELKTQEGRGVRLFEVFPKQL